MNRRPAFLFYPRDWRQDPELRGRSFAARGLWIELIALMHECEPYGTCTSGGRPMTMAEIAKNCGGEAREVEDLIGELLQHGVAERTQDGAICCRRMMRLGEAGKKKADAARKAVTGAPRDDAGRYRVRQEAGSSSSILRSQEEKRSISVASPTDDGGSLRSAAGAAPLAASAEKPVDNLGAPQPPPDPDGRALRAWWSEWWRATEGKAAAQVFDPATGQMAPPRPCAIPRPIAEAYRAKAARIGHEAILAATRRAIAAGNLPRAIPYLEGL